MRRLFVDKISDNIILSGDDHMHLSVVLRAKKNDTVILCPCDGYDYNAIITDIKKNETHLNVISKEINNTEPSIDVTLFYGVLKGDKNDLVVQKAVELGVNNIYPFISKFVQTKSESIKTQRLNKIALEAAKQSGRGIIPKVSEPINFDSLIQNLKEYNTIIFAYENADTNIKSYLEKADDFTKTAIVVGAEGGFSEEEVLSLANSSIVPLSLGKRILRAETACISIVSLVMYAAEQLK